MNDWKKIERKKIVSGFLFRQVIWCEKIFRENKKNIIKRFLSKCYGMPHLCIGTSYDIYIYREMYAATRFTHTSLCPRGSTRLLSFNPLLLRKTAPYFSKFYRDVFVLVFVRVYVYTKVCCMYKEGGIMCLRFFFILVSGWKIYLKLSTVRKKKKNISRYFITI